MKGKIYLQTDGDEPADQSLICCLKPLSIFLTDLKMLVVEEITERYRPCAVNAAKTNDAIKLQLFEANKHARTFQTFVNTYT